MYSLGETNKKITKELSLRSWTEGKKVCKGNVEASS